MRQAFFHTPKPLRLVSCVLTVAAMASIPTSAVSSDQKAKSNATADLPTGIWAEFKGHLNADHLKVGDSLLATVTYPWQSKDCTLREGAILQGQVVALQQRTANSPLNEVSLNFEGTCNEGASLPLILYAVLKPTNDEPSNQVIDSLPMSIGSGGRSVGSLADLIPTNSQNEMRRDFPAVIKPGEVWGISHLNLSVATGVNGSSVLSTSSRTLHLNFATNLIFFPRPEPRTVTAMDGNVRPADTSASEPKPVEVVDETELCSPPSCSVALAETEPSDAGPHAAASFSIAGMGYSPRLTRELTELDYDAAIAYLGGGELLFTFNPHKLVPRSSKDYDDVARVIRAEVIDLDGKAVTHTVDWRVPDGGQYLWPVGQDHVVVHIGNELRMYGPGLSLEQKMLIDGRLSFLRVSPDGKLLAVGVIRERHSRQVHRQLEESSSDAPEEDVAIHVVDASFKPIGELLRTSASAPPVLTNAGEVRALPDGHQRWLIQEETWDRHTRKIATVASSCAVTTVALRGDLLFVRGCDVHVRSRWYRAIRMDGHTVLKGEVSGKYIEAAVLANESTATFVLAMAKSGEMMLSGAPFHGSDLASETIGVYEANNGKRIFAANVASPAPTKQTFALSPQGDSLAVLQGNEISFYSIVETNTRTAQQSSPTAQSR